MKSVVLATAYKEWKFLPAFLRGIEANRDQIEKVLIVHDGPITDFDLSGLPEFVTVAQTETQTGNPVKPLNLGFFLIPDGVHVVGTALDMVLGPGAVKHLQAVALPGHFTTGLCLPIGREPTTTYPPIPIDKDFLSGAIDHFAAVDRYWRYARNGLFGCWSQDWRKVGGHNERLSGHVYASEEYDLALRWLIEFGPKTYRLNSLVEGYHHEETRRNYTFDELYRGKLSLYPSRLILAETYLKFYFGRVQMFCRFPDTFNPSFFNVKHTAHAPEHFGWHYDIWLDCWKPWEWIRPRELNSLRIPYLPLHWDSPSTIFEFLESLKILMPPGGDFDIQLQPHREMTPEIIGDYLSHHGFEVDSPQGDRLVGWRE